MKVLYLFAAFAAAMCVGSCANGDGQLDKLVAGYSQLCPMEITREFTLDKVGVDSGYVVYRYVYADSLYNPKKSIEEYGPEVAKTASLNALRDNQASRQVFDAVLESGCGMKYVYIGVPSGDSCALVITPEEVQKSIPAGERK